MEQFTRVTLIVWCVFVAGCAPFPITDGMGTVFPRKHAQVVVWGNDTRTINSAIIWLQKRGIVVLERGAIKLALNEKSLDFSHTLEDEALVLRMSKDLGLDTVIFVDRVGDLRAPMVAIRGVDVLTNQVWWSGSARYASYTNQTPSDQLVNLTCHALATAWGFQVPGTQYSVIQSNPCE